MRPSFRPSSIHIMLIVLLQIASKRGLKIGIILFIYIHIKLRATLSPLCHSRIIKMREQCQLICSNRSLKIRILESSLSSNILRISVDLKHTARKHLSRLKTAGMMNCCVRMGELTFSHMVLRFVRSGVGL